VTRTVTIDGLEAERPHTLSSVALDADTGEELGSPDGVGTGAEGKAEVELGPAEDSATVTLTYALDEAALGRNVRFRDVLSLDGRVLLRSDGRADGAAAPLPYLRSCASGAHTGMAAEPARADAAVDCTLSYAGLELGAAYTAQGTLQIVSEDGAGVELAAADGTPVGASADFVATATGSVRLSYALNTSALGASALGASALDASALAGRRLRARSPDAAPKTTPMLPPRAPGG
jgi:hypothetical protein